MGTIFRPFKFYPPCTMGIGQGVDMKISSGYAYGYTDYRGGTNRALIFKKCQEQKRKAGEVLLYYFSYQRYFSEKHHILKIIVVT